MTDTWLTADEVKELTGRTRWKAQCRKLAEMDVPFRPNGVGRPLVERSVALPNEGKRTRKRAEPNWDAMNGQAKAA